MIVKLPNHSGCSVQYLCVVVDTCIAKAKIFCTIFDSPCPLHIMNSTILVIFLTIWLLNLVRDCRCGVDDEKFLDDNDQFLEDYTNSSESNQGGRSGRFLPVLAVVRLSNSIQCTFNGQTGACKTSKQCDRDGGTAFGGSCGNGYGVCCMTTLSCSTMGNQASNGIRRVRSSGTHLTQPSMYTPPFQCQFQIPRRTGVCQVRLDFLTFSLAGPDLSSNCVTDSLTITGAANLRNFVTCGQAMGQQLILQYGSSDIITVNINLGVQSPAANQVGAGMGMMMPNAASSYDILVTLVDCPSDDHQNGVKQTKRRGQSGRSMFSKNSNNNNNMNMNMNNNNDVTIEPAPVGCGQYFTRSMGTVRSFNYQRVNIQSNQMPIQINNEMYTVCIKTPPGSSSITWSPCTATDSFFVSGGQPMQGNSVQCQTDYVDIPGSPLGRYCGDQFPAMVTTTAQPYIMYVNFNGEEIYGANRPISPDTGCLLGDECWVMNVQITAPPRQCDFGNPISATFPGQCRPSSLVSSLTDFGNTGFCLQYSVS